MPRWLIHFALCSAVAASELSSRAIALDEAAAQGGADAAQTQGVDNEKQADQKQPAEPGVKQKPPAEKAAAKKHGKDDEPAGRSAKRVKKLEKKLPASAEEQEQAALALVREHHPELGELLAKLKADNPKQYQQAVKELYRSSLRLSQFKENDPRRYELELKAWQLDSQVRLLAARLTMETRPELEEQLKASLLEREDVRIELLKLDRERTAERLEALDRQLSTHREQRIQRSEQAFDKLLRWNKVWPKAKALKKAQPAKEAPKAESAKSAK